MRDSDATGAAAPDDASGSLPAGEPLGTAVLREQRESPRYPCRPEASCQLVLAGGVRFQAERIQNLSAAGLTLVVDRMLTVGSVISVELHGEEGRVCSRRMRIIYYFKEPTGDCLLGGAFTRKLTEAELRAFVDG